jgi:hypothetical protein
MPTAGRTVAIAIADTDNHVLARQALLHSCKLFPPDQVIIFSDDPQAWPGFEIIQIPKITSINEYNRLIVKDLPNVLKCDFVLVIQYDGFVLHPEEFANLFFHYDYIGAPWGGLDEPCVGNGGFSLRSRKFVEEAAKIDYPDLSVAEDYFLCRLKHDELRDLGIHFAPKEIARHFAVEWPPVPWKTFGFHGILLLPNVYRNNPTFLSDNLSNRIKGSRSLYLDAAALLLQARIHDRKVS